MAADMQPGQQTKTVSRNTKSLVLFGRTVVITLSVISGCLGFYTGIRLTSESYNPHSYATGTGALFAAACAVIAFLLTRRRAAKGRMRTMEMRIEELSDSNWELREAEVRARSLLEAQGDLIIRRDAQGLVTYVNDAYCALAGKSRDQLLGQQAGLPVLEQGATTMLADGTRAHDQKIAGGQNPGGSAARWIAWREVAVRTETGNEMQGVGRDVTDRVEAERAFAAARDLAEAIRGPALVGPRGTAVEQGEIRHTVGPQLLQRGRGHIGDGKDASRRLRAEGRRQPQVLVDDVPSLAHVHALRVEPGRGRFAQRRTIETQHAQRTG